MLSKLRSNLLLLIIVTTIVVSSLFVMYKIKIYLKRTNVLLERENIIMQQSLNRLTQNTNKLLEIEEQKSLEKLLGNSIENFVDKLKIYTVFKNNKQIKMIRVGGDYDGGYIVPEIALQEAEALIGYGVRDNIKFEEQFSDLYNKGSYGFDCSTKSIKTQNKLTHFIPECIGTSEFIEGTKQDSMKITNFKQQLKTLNLENKKLFIKMDIEGAEYDALPEILNYSKNITGIALEIHFSSHISQFKQALNLLSMLNKDFILLHVHGCNCTDKYFTSQNSEGSIPKILELSYINKSLVNNFIISNNQSHPTEMDMPICPTKQDSKFTIKTCEF